jgi:TetR/AcrR family transcriptional regulator, cholesterol catabolism regulator
MDQVHPDTSLLQAKAIIVQRSAETFMRLGIRAMNMADLASELGISKKTLYKYVQDKTELVNECMAWHCDQMQEVIDSARDSSENTIDAELQLIQFIHHTTAQMHPSILFDLRKHHPDAFELVNERRNQILQGTVVENIKRGQREGLYRLDVLPEVAAQFLLGLSEHVRALAESSDNTIPLSQLYLQSAMYHIRAISAARGLEYLEEKIQNENLFK